jgi:secreted trypsin-like serine protease
VFCWITYFISHLLKAPNIVLSAAHCVPQTLSRVQAHVNPFDLGNPNDNSVLSSINDIRTHPGFTFLNQNDVMLLRLVDSVPSSVASPVRLNADSNEPEDGDSLTVVGWGLTIRDVLLTSPVLQQTSVDYITNGACYLGLVSSDMMCCVEAGQGTCKGDSGGPLLIPGDGEDVQVGITSWGLGCAVQELPGKALVANLH